MKLQLEFEFVTYIHTSCEVNPGNYNGALSACMCYEVCICSQMTGLQRQ